LFGGSVGAHSLVRHFAHCSVCSSVISSSDGAHRPVDGPDTSAGRRAGQSLRCATRSERVALSVAFSATCPFVLHTGNRGCKSTEALARTQTPREWLSAVQALINETCFAILDVQLRHLRHTQAMSEHTGAAGGEHAGTHGASAAAAAAAAAQAATFAQMHHANGVVHPMQHVTQHNYFAPQYGLGHGSTAHASLLQHLMVDQMSTFFQPQAVPDLNYYGQYTASPSPYNNHAPMFGFYGSGAGEQPAHAPPSSGHAVGGRIMPNAPRPSTSLPHTTPSPARPSLHTTSNVGTEEGTAEQHHPHMQVFTCGHQGCNKSFVGYVRMAHTPISPVDGTVQHGHAPRNAAGASTPCNNVA
jgi:hypothetical protein